jgi:aldehyde dehydrogenase (NAD+)
MREYLQFFIDGRWVDPLTPKTLDVIDPATDRPSGRISLGSARDVDLAVAAARRAFDSYSRTSRQSRLDLLGRILTEYNRRIQDVADAISAEMGAPPWLALHAQAPAAIAHLTVAIEALRSYAFEEKRGSSLLAHEPIGVCGLITPWNWPINQVAVKVIPALAVGCTMVLKPSEVAPLSSIVWAEILAAAGVPAGVFNLVNGDGPTVGAAIAAHPGIDMVSFTGSTRAGIEVARLAAPTVKRVTQELGGKSPNIVLEDADLAAAVVANIQTLALNSGQSCNAPTRLLVPFARMAEAKEAAHQAIRAIQVGKPDQMGSMGPVASRTQWQRIQGLIEKGLAEGATLVVGGLGLPDGISEGSYVRPTVFADVRNDMAIAREEIFGPVLVIIGYETEKQAIAMANDTLYGLAAYVQGKDMVRVREVASQLRAGQIIINGAALDFTMPFGGYKQSGNGREWGAHAFSEYLETKSVLGYSAAAVATA